MGFLLIFLYQGKGDSIVTIETPVPFELGEKVILKLCENIPEGCNIYMDRYFTTVRGIDELHAKGLHATGTLQKHKIASAPTSRNLQPIRKKRWPSSYCEMAR